MQQSTDVVRRTNWVDPICGMQVDPSTAAAEDVFIGVRYLFCSEECHRLFIKSAPRWITELAHGGDCIGHVCPIQRSHEDTGFTL